MIKDKTQIPTQEPYNPLEKRNIGESIVKAMLDRPKEKLPPRQFIWAGVYAIYYEGGNLLYKNLEKERPIYVGKAVPSGARKGNVGVGENQGQALYSRLRQHADSIDASSNLRLCDFRCRYLAVDDIWIPLAETLLIEKFQPAWNVVIDGFGNHDPGKGRYNQQRSAWDTIHPGRAWAERLKPSMMPAEDIMKHLDTFIRKGL